jgi:hypothetical protein
MATTYTWKVTAMNCYPQEGGNTDVVFTVHWTCFGVNGDYSSSVYSTCSVPTPTGSFTPYAQLTQSQVLGWIYANGVDQTATEAVVEQQIQNQTNPPVVTPPLPWPNTPPV